MCCLKIPIEVYVLKEQFGKLAAKMFAVFFIVLQKF